MIKNDSKLLLALCVSAFLLTGCGGSSGGDVGPAPNGPTPPPATPVPDNQPVDPIVTQDGLHIYGDTGIVTGQAVGFGVTTDNSENISSIAWTQVSGPSQLTILADHTQAIGFDALVAGDYTLRINATTASSRSLNTDYQFTVNQDVNPNTSIRLDHSATERGRVSLRVVSNVSKAINQIQWSQIAGPDAQDVLLSESTSPNTPDGQVIVFNAPAVENDSVIKYQATIRYSDNTESTETAIVVVTNDEINPDGYFPNSNLIVTSNMFAFNPNSPHADALEACVYNNQITQSCTFGRLPLIGQESEAPDVDAILDRTLVSHAWMGERFEQYLRNSVAGPDMLLLLRAATAVVISYEVRPSFYWAVTGAIYLDARNFWSTPEERDTLNEQRDFRSDFGNDLSFIIPWRYVKNNQYYPVGSYPIEQRLNRTFADLEASISWLMYHELGHANDFFPPARWASLSDNNDPLSFFQDNGATSDIFPSIHPLDSEELKALAQVSFAGETATSTQRGYQATDIEQFFTGDRAPAYYSYSTTREDFATLFERFMMAYRLKASADVAIMVDPDINNELLITWGQRDRFNVPELQSRVEFAVETILPELDVDSVRSSLPTPLLMDPSKNWFDNIALGENAVSLESVEVRELRRQRRLDPIWLHGPDVEMPIPEKQ